MSTAASTSTGLEPKPLKAADKHVPRAIQLAMTLSDESSTLTIEEHNMNRFVFWIQLLVIPAIFITTGVAQVRDELIGGAAFPWWLPVVILDYVYMTVVQLALGHLGLFFPQTPYAAWEALNHVGFRLMTIPIAVTCGAALLIDQAWLLVACAGLLGVLVAAVIAYWVCLARTFGG